MVICLHDGEWLVDIKFEVLLGCPMIGLCAYSKVHTSPYGSLAYPGGRKLHVFKILGMAAGQKKMLAYPLQ